jgi:radical SAM protein with 4Fe4S-binding SPASM domain
MMAYNYYDKKPEYISLNKLTEKQQDLLMESKTFCMLPWTHLHAFPTGKAYPCCLGGMNHPIGNLREQTLEEIWNGEPMRELRNNMLIEKKSDMCNRCYEQEDMGFFSMRNSSNKRFGHHVGRTEDTKEDGTVDDMKLTYWDIRFSNLCNLRCRSCGHIFSSNWYDDQVKIIEDEQGKDRGTIWKEKNSRIEYAGRTQTDAWEQLEPHLEHVEQIYFAGGEPLIMEEHYRILNELLDRGNNKVRLIYNTNFSEMRYKKTNVLDLWNKFTNVCVGASLDAMGPLGEFMRKGTDWAQVERNREMMLEKCPGVDFYISPTLSVMNVHQLPSFHRDWVSKGLIRPQDLNVNILQSPDHYRIDILPADMKERLVVMYSDHLEWLRPQDDLRRATVGFESAIKFMMEDDKTRLIPEFWKKTDQLDRIRNENILDIVPELEDMR